MVLAVPNSVYGKKFWVPGPLWSLGHHTGLDLIAPVGSRIVAAIGGKVLVANSYDRNYGYKVIIGFTYGGVKYQMWYCHMPKDAADVEVGDTVVTGQQIGNVGVTGNTTGAHCHVELRVAPFTFSSPTKANPTAYFRDPMKFMIYKPGAINFPKPTPVDKRDWMDIKVATVNCGYYNDHGKKTYKERYPKIAIKVKQANSQVVALQELGQDSVGLMRELLPNYSFGNGSDGRWVLIRKDAMDDIHSEVFTCRTKYKGDDKQAVIRVAERAGVKGCFVSLHTENEDASGRTQVAQFAETYERALEVCSKYGVSLANLQIMGDMNSENLVREWAEDHHYASAFDLAKDTTNKYLNSINNWKTPVRGPHSDYLFVRHSGKTNVPVDEAIQLNSPIYTDHGMMFFKTYLLK